MGANYTPGRGWFHHWLDFDPDDVHRDFDALAGLGLDHVRVFALWPVFQPNRALVRPRALDQLGQLVDAAAGHGLDVAVDALQGHLSSFDFMPSWLRSWHRRNMFTDPEAIDGEVRYLEALARTLAGRPNFLGLSLGNEVNQFSGPPHPDPDTCTREEAGAWLERLLAVCERAAPGKLHTHCEYDAVWFQDGHPFTPAHAARLGAVTAVHSWVFNGTAQHHGPGGTATVRHAEYLIELSKAWARDPRRPVWLQEVGAPAPLVPARQAAAFTEATLTNALTCEDLYGITWWCSHDVSRELADFPELEYGLGLLTCEGDVKPAGRAVAGTAARLRADPPRPVLRRTALVLDAGEAEGAGGGGEAGGGDAAPGRSVCAPGGTFFEAWARLADQGVRAAVVLAGRARDAGHLAARGITEVVRPEDVG
ncbi:glycosyl hydrolase [Streptomyces sp. MST-110588]|uniref:glycoside hydrolase 5 family protein n=1 Tax=Streptomyces sp. MST-110588 TaxID=2833628 RepID=UPI001F5D186E|nr:glycosyl hydrolase [Streptomyces sp. MST-110588]UNO44080.1 glycosyl hydrolase [Streptomyces sp. MST-110588]